MKASWRNQGSAPSAGRQITGRPDLLWQQTQLGGADPQATATAASKQLDAFLATYKGAPML